MLFRIKNEEMMRVFLSCALTLALTQPLNASDSNVTKNNKSFVDAVRNIADENERERVVAFALQLCEGTDWKDNQQTFSLLLPILHNFPVDRESFSGNLVAGIKSREKPDLGQVSLLLRDIRLLSPEQWDAFKIIAEGREWLTNDFKAVSTRLYHLENYQAPMVLTQELPADFDAIHSKRPEGPVARSRVVQSLGEGLQWTGDDCVIVFNSLSDLQFDAQFFEAVEIVKDITAGRKFGAQTYVKCVKQLQVEPTEQQKRKQALMQVLDHVEQYQDDLDFLIFGVQQAPTATVVQNLEKVKKFAAAHDSRTFVERMFVHDCTERRFERLELLLKCLETLGEGKNWALWDMTSLMRNLDDFFSDDSTLECAVQVLRSHEEWKNWDFTNYYGLILAIKDASKTKMTEVLSGSLTIEQKYNISVHSTSLFTPFWEKNSFEEAQSAVSQVGNLMVQLECPIESRRIGGPYSFSHVTYINGQRTETSSSNSELQSGSRVNLMLILLSLDLANIAPTVSALQSLFEINNSNLNEMPSCIFGEIVRALSALTPERQQTMGELISEIGNRLGCKFRPYHFANIIANLGPIASDNVDALIDTIKGLAEGRKWQAEEYNAILPDYSQLDTNQSQRVIGMINGLERKRVLTHEDIVQLIFFTKFIERDRPIPEEHLLVILDATRNINNLVDRVLSPVIFFDHLSNISPRNFAEVMAIAEALAQQAKMRDDEFLDVLSNLSEISKYRREFVHQKAPVLVESFGINPRAVVSGLSVVNTERLDDTLQAYQILGSIKDFKKADTSELFNSLCRLPSACQIQAVAKKLCVALEGKDWSVPQCSMVATLLGKLDSDEWEKGLCALEPFTSYRGYCDPSRSIELDMVLFPSSQVMEYLSEMATDFETSPEQFFSRNQVNRVANFFLSLLAVATKREQLFDYWREVMSSENKALSASVCEFIEENCLVLGFDEMDELPQLALRVLTVLEDGDENGAHTIFEKMKAKREVPVAWERLKDVKGCVAGLNIRLNPERVASFGRSLKIDMSSVPMIHSPAWIGLVANLRSALERQPDPETNTSDLMKEACQIYVTTLKGYDPLSGTVNGKAASEFRADVLGLIDEAQSPHEHFCRLMNSSWKNLEGAKMRCVANYFLNLADGDSKWIRLCQFLAGVRGCLYGKDTAVQDYYMGLDTRFRLKTMAPEHGFDFDLRQLTAVTSLFHAVQSVVSMQFSPESKFMREVCGIHVTDQEFEYAAHQIIWVKGLIGDKVGLSEGPRFDIHAGTANRLVLERSLQEVMEIYYNGIELKNIIPLLRTAFNNLLLKEAEMRAKLRQQGENDQGVSIYSSMKHMFEQMKANYPEEVFEGHDETGNGSPWVQHTYANDEDTVGQLTITDRCMVRLMNKAGLLDDVSDPLGWGNK
jgi:hypothetical protein